MESQPNNQVEKPTRLNMQNVDSPLSRQTIVEVLLLVCLCFIYAGDAPPMINEAHYLVKAKNFWQPEWCANDLFASSGKAHAVFYALFGWPTLFFSLETTAWMGRIVGWLLIAVGVQRLTRQLLDVRYACLAVAILWIAGVEYGNLAGEWVIGGIEAKVPAYGFVLLAMAEMVDRRWNRVWVLLGTASAIHVLSGGWSVIAASIAWWITERKRSSRHPFFTRYLFLGGAIALFGVVPAVWLTIGNPPDQSTMAAKIYTFFRLSHHLVPSAFAPIWYFRFGVLTFAAVGLSLAIDRQFGFAAISSEEQAKWDRLQAFAMGAFAIAVIGLLLGWMTIVDRDLEARLLRYYWFRLSDAVIPLLLSLLVVRGIFSRNAQKPMRRVCFAMMTLAIGLFLLSSQRSIHLPVPPAASNRVLQWDADAPAEVQQDVWRDWIAVCRWVRSSTRSDAVLLTPRHQQTFKWYAERAEVVNWKDVPQNTMDLLEWYRRFRDVFPQRLGTVRVTIRYSSLIAYRERYGVDMIVVDRRVVGNHLPLVQLYPLGDDSNDTYAVYELPHGQPKQGQP
ncbi:hypothetical protein Q31b_16190 [Novipirellula aureliae]|uniref:DUF6798 domain-containing protein n=1 Tax=Novipirellula aureliae TaxID=2527966 RepID=A0A5C6E671_9BACT|nr:DUF6798 domain-containing protein [Novipirellula aureliae]TWU44084.1 hypothetical protein Q31b_16190 [Novipirellula aureliae]